MQITQTVNEGLSRKFVVNVSAKELGEKLTAKIEEVRPRMNLKGFRPGKVPAAHVRKMYGRDLMGEMINKLVDDTNDQALKDNSLRPAGTPKVEVESDIEKVVRGEADFAYSMSVDIMPEFTPADMSAISIVRPVNAVSDEQVEEALKRLAEQNLTYDKREDGAEAVDGDAVVVDFLGKLHGVPFDGGQAENQTVVLGSNRFIAGFEEQLIGAKAGEDRVISVTFPEAYPSANLAGQAATFDIKVHEVRAPKTPEISEDFAKGLGLESLEQLNTLIREQLQREHDGASRNKAKRNLLDRLDEAHSFDLPPGMVEQEFGQIWQQLQKEMDAGRVPDEEKKKPEDELRTEYRAIAERRVRLGLVLAEVGRLADIRITDEEVRSALLQEARAYPGQERQVIQFYQNNPGAMAQLRAPIYEEKVVDHILGIAQVTDAPVSREELFKEDDA